MFWMTGFLLAAVVSTAKQGSAVEVKILNEPHVKAVAVVRREEKVPAVLAGSQWAMFLGVDLDTKPGVHKTSAVVTMDDGSLVRRDVSVSASAKAFPTTKLEVAEKFVQLNKADLTRSQRESREANAIYQRITTAIVPDEAFTDPIPGVGGTNFGCSIATLASAEFGSSRDRAHGGRTCIR